MSRNKNTDVSRADKSVKKRQNLPILRPALHNINAHTKIGEIHWYLLKFSSVNENMNVSRAVNSAKINESCPLAIPQKGKRKVQGVPQSQTAALSRH